MKIRTLRRIAIGWGVAALIIVAAMIVGILLAPTTTASLNERAAWQTVTHAGVPTGVTPGITPGLPPDLLVPGGRA